MHLYVARARWLCQCEYFLEKEVNVNTHVL